MPAVFHFMRAGVFNVQVGMYIDDVRRKRMAEARRQHMIILCILIFPFAVLAELMKMNNRGGCRR
jgi:hypothetical protein